MRLGEHAQLGNGAVHDRNKNGQHARGPKRYVSHVSLHTYVYGEDIARLAEVKTVLYGCLA
jgi:hypothetical protein